MLELFDRVAKVQWFHSIDLGNGLVTNGAKPDKVLRQEADIIFKDGVAGLSVLDVGAWNGFFSFEAEKRGAARVLATDWFCWGGPGWGTKEGFDIAKEALQSQVEEKELDVSEISSNTVGEFDVVLFLGVLYHLRHPLLALEQIARVTKRTLIVETALDAMDQERPMMVFYPEMERDGDPTNWWAPNVACVLGMLGSVGFRNVEYTPHPIGSRGIFFAHR